MKFVKFSVLLAMICIPSLASALTLQQFTIEGRYFYDTQNSPVTGVCSDGHFLYLTQRFDSLKVYSLASNGLPLVRLGACQASNKDYIYLVGHLLIAVGYSRWNGYDIYDVSDVNSPIRVSHMPGDVIFRIKTAGNMLYVPLGNDITDGAFKAYDISDPANPLMTEYIRPGDGNWGFDFDLKGNIGYTTFYGYHSTVILDISDSYNIQIVGNIPQEGSAIKVYGNSLFLGSSVYGGNLMYIYSLSDPLHPALVSTLDYGYDATTDIQLIDGLLYTLNAAGKITLCDIGGYNPPESLGTAILPAINSLDGLWMPQMACVGNTVYYAAGDSGLYVLRYTGEMPLNTGDANSTGAVNGIDVIYLANYFKGWGPPPTGPRERGDTNGDCVFNGLDETYLVNYLKGGPPPVRGFCYGQ